MSVLDALTADLDRLRKRDALLADSTLAAAALALARELDNAGNSATSKSMCAKALTDTWERLMELAPPEKKADRVDEVAARRSKRRGAA